MDNEQQDDGNNKPTPDDQAPSAVTAKIVSIATAARERNARQRAVMREQQQLELPIEELLPAESGQSKYPTLLGMYAGIPDFSGVRVKASSGCGFSPNSYFPTWPTTGFKVCSKLAKTCARTRVG